MTLSNIKVSFLKIIGDLNKEIEKLNSARSIEGLPRFEQFRVTVLGQFSLFLNQYSFENLPLALTVDFDALIVGDWILKKEFKDRIKKLGFVYDELSEEIWVAENSEYDVVYESENILVKSIQPLYCLLSKAIKAPEKNRILIKEAKLVYKKELTNLIEKYDGK